MSKIPMYEIRSKKNRRHVFMFQNEDGTIKGIFHRRNENGFSNYREEWKTV